MAAQENRNYSDLAYGYKPAFVAATMNKFADSNIFKPNNLHEFVFSVKKYSRNGTRKLYKYYCEHLPTGRRWSITPIQGIRMAKGIQYTANNGTMRRIRQFVYKVPGFTSLENFMLNRLLQLVQDGPTELSNLSAHYETKFNNGTSVKNQWNSYYVPTYSTINIPNARNLTARLGAARQRALNAQNKENTVRAASFARIRAMIAAEAAAANAAETAAVNEFLRRGAAAPSVEAPPPTISGRIISNKTVKSRREGESAAAANEEGGSAASNVYSRYGNSLNELISRFGTRKNKNGAGGRAIGKKSGRE